MPTEFMAYVDLFTLFMRDHELIRNLTAIAISFGVIWALPKIFPLKH